MLALLLTAQLVSATPYRYSDSSDAGDSVRKFDGSYRFTALGEELQINVCGDDDSAYYMSINVVKDLKLNSFVFGVFYDLDGPRALDYNDHDYELNFDGYQMELSGFGFNQYTYKLRENYGHNDYENNDYLLMRYESDKYNKYTSKPEIFILDKISDFPEQECMAPKARFDVDVDYPAMYRSQVNVKQAGVCPEDCFGIESHENAYLDNSCWTAEDALTDEIYGGGCLPSVDLVWNGQLSLGKWINIATDESDACHTGTRMAILTDKRTLVVSWRCVEGHAGATYRNDQTNTDHGHGYGKDGARDYEECPLLTPEPALPKYSSSISSSSSVSSSSSRSSSSSISSSSGSGTKNNDGSSSGSGSGAPAEIYRNGRWYRHVNN